MYWLITYQAITQSRWVLLPWKKKHASKYFWHNSGVGNLLQQVGQIWIPIDTIGPYEIIEPAQNRYIIKKQG